ncbi:MAG: helix-turn-helix transcriptional regulator [Gemmatimonadota bacterium]|nr:helix-turn-helix transcriptional regulator [Gemmatimonadota bacterium]
MSRETESGIVKGGPNVFADLDLPAAEDLLGKAHLAAAIGVLIDARGLTQGEAARLLGASQPTVSNLVRGRLSGFSLDRLLRFLNALGAAVEIRVAAPAIGAGPAATRVSLDGPGVLGGTG